MTNQLKITNNGCAVYLLQHFSKKQDICKSTVAMPAQDPKTYAADKKTDFLKNLNQSIMPSLWKRLRRHLA